MKTASPVDRVTKKRRWIMAGFALLLVLTSSFLFDGFVDGWVVAHRTSIWETAAKICSRYLAWPWLIASASAGLLLAWFLRRHDWMRVLCAMMIAASLAGLSADLLRGITGRTRPYAQVPQGWHGVRTGSQWLITQHAYNSFPSGHVAAAAGFGLPLFFWRRLLGAVVLPFVTVVAGARVYIGAHHLSDVVAATILGSLVAAWVWHRFDSGKWIVKGFPLRRGPE